MRKGECDGTKTRGEWGREKKGKEVSRGTSYNKQICSRVSAPVRGDIFTDCQLNQAGKIDYTFPKILSLPGEHVAQEALVFKFELCFGVSAMTSHFRSERNIYIPTWLPHLSRLTCTRDCTKLVVNGSGHCNQQFDLISSDNDSMVIG